MDVATLSLNGVEVWVSRSGYTGEDGYEISVPNDAVEGVAKALLDHPDVEAIGLGARDSLQIGRRALPLWTRHGHLNHAG